MDCASRSLTPRQLSEHRLWWQGPTWLSLPQHSWPSSPADTSTECDIEQRPGLIFTASMDPSSRTWDLLQRYSSLIRLLRIISLCKRAVPRFKWLTSLSLANPITPQELEDANLFWIRHVQQAYFTAELQTIANGNAPVKGNPLVAPTPFVDRFGTLRVGDRLHQSPLQPEAKHPPVLPRASPLTTLVIADAHFRTLHGGTQTVLIHLLRSYWIPGG